MTATRLPSAFAEFEQFAENWCLATEPERWNSADGTHHAGDPASSTTRSLPGFEEAIEYCDKFPLDDVPDDALNLLHLIYSMIMISMAVEVFGHPEARPTPPTPSSTASGSRCRETGDLSLLTINKLTDSVGAEVLGVDSDRLATDDALGEAVLVRARGQRRAGVSGPST